MTEYHDENAEIKIDEIIEDPEVKDKRETSKVDINGEHIIDESETETENGATEPVTDETDAKAKQDAPEADADKEPVIEDAPKAKSELEQAQDLADEYKDMAQRIQAEFENYKKRNADLYRKAYADGKEDILTATLAILDNLERGFDAMATGKEKDGIALIIKQFKDFLKANGVDEIEAENKPFDPNVHNAVMREEREGVEEGIVLEVFQKGYKTKNKVLRHSLVKVSV